MIKLFQSNLPEGVTIGHNETDRMLEAIAAFLLLSIWGLCFYIYAVADAPIAIHFNLAGKPDSWGSASSLFMIAGVSTLVMCLMAFVAYRPKLVNLPVKLRAECLSGQYTLMGRMARVFNVIFGCMFLFILLSMAAPFWGIADITIFISMVPLSILALLVVTGYYTIRINRC